MIGVLILKFLWEGLPWGFFYDALFEEDDSGEGGEEGKGQNKEKEKEEEKERKRMELCDARVITMEELMNELDLGPILEDPNKK